MGNPVRTCGLGLKEIKMCSKKIVIWTCDFSGDFTSVSVKANREFRKVSSPRHSGWDSPKVTWLVLDVAHTFLTLSLFLCNTITGTLYLDIPENLLTPQSIECSPHRNVVSQQDSTLPHFLANVRYFGCHIPRSAERTSCAIFRGLLTHWTWCQWTVPLGSN